MPKYKVLEPFAVESGSFTPGEIVELTEEQAALQGPKVEKVEAPETPAA